jgi:hypothetical protein
VSHEAKPADPDFREELPECTDRVEAKAEDGRLAECDGRVGIRNAEQGGGLRDSRAPVDDLDDQSLEAAFVDELDLALVDGKRLRGRLSGGSRSASWSK